VLSHQDHHHRPQGPHPGRRAHRVRRTPGLRVRQADRAHRGGELPQQAPRGGHPRGADGPGGRLQPRDHQLPAGGAVPGLLQAPQRQHHQRAHPGGGRGGGLQQRQGHARRRPRHPGQGADQERRAGAADRLQRHSLRQGGPAHPGGGPSVRRRGAGLRVRDGGPPSGAPRGVLRGQQPHPDGGHRHGEGGRAGR